MRTLWRVCKHMRTIMLVGRASIWNQWCSPWNQFQRKLKPNEQTLISLEMKWNPPDTLASAHVAFSLIVGETPSPVLNCTVYVGTAQHRDNVKGNTDAKWLQNVKKTQMFPFMGLLLWTFYRYLCNIVCWVSPISLPIWALGVQWCRFALYQCWAEKVALLPWSWRQGADCQT